MPNLGKYGGEGKEAYKGNKNNSSLGQHGGEGTESYSKKGGEGSLLKTGGDYRGPAGNLRTSK